MFHRRRALKCVHDKVVSDEEVDVQRNTMTCISHLSPSIDPKRAVWTKRKVLQHHTIRDSCGAVENPGLLDEVYFMNGGFLLHVINPCAFACITHRSQQNCFVSIYILCTPRHTCSLRLASISFLCTLWLNLLLLWKVKQGVRCELT